MALASNETIRIEQCLFGYDEGHRLLASSSKISDEATSLLLPLTDLVPGLSSGKFESYWTGLPIASLKSYALMHTWPAPEMSRPGCVWTHVLLVGLADIGRLSNLGVLRHLFQKPLNSGDFGSYREQLTAPVSPLTGIFYGASPSSTDEILTLLRAVYQSRARGVVAGNPKQVDNAVFSVWSQQWPRLRRSFSFRTSGGGTDSLGARPRFDLQVVRETPGHENRPADLIHLDSWEEVALADITAGPTLFREFLWRYGADQHRGRERFRFLAQLYDKTRVPVLTGSTLAKTLDEVVAVLPDENDGKLLKEDLVSIDREDESLLPTIDPLGLLEYLADGVSVGLPAPGPSVYQAVHDLWSSDAARILSISEKAIERGSAVCDEMLNRIAAVVPSASLLQTVRDHPVLRERLVKENPELLDAQELAEIPQPDLNLLLAHIDTADLAARAIVRLISVHDKSAADLLTQQFPDIAETVVYNHFAGSLRQNGAIVSQVWLDAVRAHNPQSLANRLVAQATSTTDLAACALLLTLDVNRGLHLTPRQWAEKLVAVSDDVRGQDRLRLLSYLLSLALARPVRGCEPLFERAFEAVHYEILNSRLPRDAFEPLARLLPNLYWWQQWDTCLRLRLATVSAYVEQHLDEKSFVRLASDEKLRWDLVELAADTKDGRKFLKRLDKLA
ncbi:hypothetical protein [Sinorhizobium sp. BJ1]|uniref:GAP1-N1 domain-containing protein n=1 Tax=Sinorhizobium sp. BJ1 TaxID=2035455 RepID=UPI000BE97F5E|nr:hypothetical protein [Sinorhizobium sp. BJ1]PDT81356.1 hypothetical protein CO676_22815 [Sinorhizobium sp. BJ1]